jgi:transcriptional regulator with XRE-family HTH domain
MVPNNTSESRTPLPVRRARTRLAEHLVSWRKLRGLTQTQLADRAGISRGTLKRLETGDLGVSVENLLRTLRALGLLENVPDALDPLASDLGRLRSEELLPQRVRPRRLDFGGESQAGQPGTEKRGG